MMTVPHPTPLSPPHPSPSPPPPPPSPPLPPPSILQRPPHDRVEITIFVSNLSEFVGRRELFSFFRSSKSVTDVYVPQKRSRFGARFDFVRFDSEEAAGLTILNTNGKMWNDKFLQVNRTAFGRVSSGLHQRKVERGLPRVEGGCVGLPMHQRSIAGEWLLSYKAVLQGV
ncbi:hypothetical protein Dimus_028341 [Dionaea muscipula]